METKHPNGTCRSTYPSWFKPKPVSYRKDKIDVFNDAYPISSAEDVLYIPTPGHTSGHSSVIFKTDDFDIIFAGDTSYNQKQLLDGELAGINAHYGQSRETYKNLMKYASNHKSIYLPSHDENSGTRLAQREFLIS